MGVLALGLSCTLLATLFDSGFALHYIVVLIDFAVPGCICL